MSGLSLSGRRKGVGICAVGVVGVVLGGGWVSSRGGIRGREISRFLDDDK